MQTMAAGEFKAKCLGLIDEVKVTGKTVIITKRGKPMARLLPFEEQTPQENSESIFGFMRGMGTITGDIVSSEFTNEEWERMVDEKWEGASEGTSGDPARYPYCRMADRLPRTTVGSGASRHPSS